VRSSELDLRQNGAVAKRSQRSEHVESSGGRSMDRRQQGRLIAIAVGVTLLVWFAVENTQDVSIHFWVTARQAPLIVVIVISVLLGALVTALIMRRRPKSKGHTGDQRGLG
jgi:uncharacterized integral membrane protein